MLPPPFDGAVVLSPDAVDSRQIHINSSVLCVPNMMCDTFQQYVDSDVYDSDLLVAKNSAHPSPRVFQLFRTLLWRDNY